MEFRIGQSACVPPLRPQIRVGLQALDDGALILAYEQHQVARSDLGRPRQRGQDQRRAGPHMTLLGVAIIAIGAVLVCAGVLFRPRDPHTDDPAVLDQPDKFRTVLDALDEQDRVMRTGI